MLHADEIDIPDVLVRRLLEEQFPAWRDLALAPVVPAGTDNVLFRLGDRLALRLPRRPGAVAALEKEQQWLPVLVRRLAAPIPEPMGCGRPTAYYPHPWSVTRWLDGKDALTTPIAASRRAAMDLAGFVKELRCIPAGDGPPPGAHNSFRGAALHTRDGGVREALEQLAGTVDTDAARAAWADALRAPAWDGPPVWLHGDLHPANLLARDGRLAGVLDFGCLGVGDPACDAMAAWMVFGADARRDFRAALEIDVATWRRGRGWALSVGLIALPYYRESHPAFAAVARRTIEEVLDDLA